MATARHYVRSNLVAKYRFSILLDLLGSLPSKTVDRDRKIRQHLRVRAQDVSCCHAHGLIVVGRPEPAVLAIRNLCLLFLTHPRIETPSGPVLRECDHS